MADQAKSKRSHKRRWICVSVLVVLLAVAIGLFFYLRSAGFQDLVRRKLVATLEEVTGGRVEIASFRWNLSQLAFDATDLTIHGLEPPSQAPYVHVDRALIQLHIISFFEKQFSVARLELQRPVVHLIVNPDGSTNAPQPKLKPVAGRTFVQQLFDLQVARADLRDGLLLVNERRLPLDFSASDLALSLSYRAQDGVHEYPGDLQIGKFDVRYGEFRDVPASAALQFTLWENALDIHDLKLLSQASLLQASGKLTNFAQPQVQLTYTASVDVAQVAAVTRSPELGRGTMLLNGSANYSLPASYSTAGHVSLRNLDSRAAGVALRRANIDADFAFTQDALALKKIAAGVFGGSVTGDAEVKNLLASQAAKASEQPASASRSRRGAQEELAAGEQQGWARLRASRLSLNELARIFASRSLPLDKLNAAGRLTGTVNLDWRESPENSVADLALDITPPERPAANELPVSGSVRGRAALRRQRIDLTALRLATPHSSLDASGSLGSNSAMLKLNANTTSLAELKPLLAGNGAQPLPIELDGSASFNGTVSGPLRRPQIAGHLQATNFSYLYTPSSGASALPQRPAAKKQHWFQRTTTVPAAPVPPTAAPARQVHFDAFSGDIQYSQTALTLHHGIVEEGGAQLHLDGTSALVKGAFTDNTQFTVHAVLQNGDIAQLQKTAGFSYPVQGKLNFAITAAGTVENPHGQGQFALAQAEWRGRAIEALTSNIAFANHAVQFDKIQLQAGRGMVAGSAAYDFRGRQARVDLKGHTVDLAELPEIQTDRLHIGGIADFTVKGSGTVEHPLVNAHLEIENLTLNDDVIGKVSGDATSEGREMTLTARSHFPRASFTLDGNVELEGDMPAHAVLRFTNLDVNPFLPARMRSQVTRQASLDGQAQLDGPLRQPRLLHGIASIQQFSVEVQHIPIKSDGPVQFSFANEVVSIEHCAVASEDTHFTVTGTIDLARDRALNLHANGGLNLKLAQTLYPDLTSYGVANVDVSIAGTPAQPVTAGRVQIEHAGISMIDLPTGLGDLNGTLIFNQDRLELQDVNARMGGGHVKLSGFMTFANTLGFNLAADGTGIRFRYSGLSVTSDQSLRLTGTLQNASLSGNVTVTRFAQIPSADLQLLLAEANAPPSLPNPKSPLNNLHLEVRILSTPELTVETSLAKLAGDVDLRLRGTAARPVLLGRINIAEGDIKLAGTKYHLERGDVTFVNPVRIDPVLDVEATTRVRDFDITIGLHGTMERLNTTYRSDPPLSTDDIVSLLAFGKTQTEQALGGTAAPGSGFAESASGALLSSALNQAVTSRVSRIFGSSTIRINPSVGGPENDPNARLTVEQQVSNNITFTYITNLARSAQEVIQFEYTINREYTLQGIRDENGVVSFDLLIRKRRQ